MKQWIIAALAGCTAMGLQAETLSVPVKAVTAEGIGESVGTVKIESNQYGLVFRPDLSGLESGAHGFHIHAPRAAANRRKRMAKPSPPGPPAATGIRRTPVNMASPGARVTWATSRR